MRCSQARTLLVAVLTGCAGAPPLPPAPSAALRIEYAPAADSAPGDALRTTVEVWTVQTPVEGIAVDLAAEVLPAESGAPFRGASELPPGTRWGTGDPRQELHERAAHDGGSATLTSSADAHLGPGLATRVLVGDLLELELRTLGRDVSVRLRVPGGNGGQVPIGPLTDGSGFLFVPCPGTRHAGYVVALRRGLVVAAHDHAERVAAVRTAAAAAAGPGEPAPWRLARQAVGADNLRQALLALATPLAAGPALDVLLVAEERTLRTVADALPQHPPGPLSPAMAWPLLRTTWQALLPAIERDSLTPALRAVAIEHFGALAGDAPTLRILLAGSTDEAQLQQRLRDENHAALADRQAAVRMRAHDWLAARRLAVAGFDPLAPLASRQQALRGFAAAVPEAGGR